MEDSQPELSRGLDFVECPHCGKRLKSITQGHNKICRNPDFKPLYSKSFLKSRAKTEAQKKAQSEKLKKRFQTPEGEATRAIIGQASKRLNADPLFRKKKSEISKRIQDTPENRAIKSKLSLEKWADPIFRSRIKQYTIDNIEKLQESARNARSYMKKQSNLHLKYKKGMLEKGLQGFISEYPFGPYSIDEADPITKVAVEIDGCYWHGCGLCGYTGDSRIKLIDKKKTTFLINRGWTIFRIKEHDIKKDPYTNIDDIKRVQTELLDQI